jgi:hypothetical protein
MSLSKTGSPSSLYVLNHILERVLIVFGILSLVEGLQSGLKLFPKLLKAAFALAKEAHGFSDEIGLGLVFALGELLPDEVFKVSG